MTRASYFRQPRVRSAEWLQLYTWIVCAAAFIAVLIGGSFTNRMSFTTAAIVLGIPVLGCAAFAVAEWRVARREGEKLTRGHLIAPVIALVIWLLYTSGGGGDLNFSKEWHCEKLTGELTAACLRDAAQALGHGRLVSWIGLAVIAALTLLARRSRVAAWSTLTVALAAQTLALHFLMALTDAYAP